MVRLPVIVGFGGINAAGRSSFHHAYRRMVIDVLSDPLADETYRSLAALMNANDAVDGVRIEQPIDASKRAYIDKNTLVRRIGPDLFDADHIPWNKRLTLMPTGPQSPISFITKVSQLPEIHPEGWRVSLIDNRTARVDLDADLDLLLPAHRTSPVKAGGQLPSGFNPRTLYQSRNHPRGLQMTVFGASDALGSMGIDWQVIRQRLSPDQISVYAGSGMSQLDSYANGGMVSSRLSGKRVTSKHCPFGFAEMPADFINAYILGSLGNTGTNMGACASFLYNVRQGLMDIHSGRARVVLVGNSEAPITPEVMEGYAAMGALATDSELLALDKDKHLVDPDYRRACRPFSTNAGFTLAESAQFMLLMDDELALELGTTIYGAISNVFINADGHKKSIASPGVGNYITVAKALADARSIVGEEGIRQRSFIEGHGTGTPQNRVTESHIMNEAAKAFGIEKWRVSAVKSYLGHSIGAAGGDQVASALGVWAHGWIPGITTIDHLAEDVHQSHLNISSEHTQVSSDGIDAAIINGKGFGGNNASCALLAPHVASGMLAKRHGKQAMLNYHRKNESVVQAAVAYDQGMIEGCIKPTYKFDHNVLSGEDIQLSSDRLSIAGYDLDIDLNVETLYTDMV